PVAFTSVDYGGCLVYVFVFFFSSRRRHTRSTRDWSSDVCSSDLLAAGPACGHRAREQRDRTDRRRGGDGCAARSRSPARRQLARSEERRVGKEWRSGRPERDRKKQKAGATRRAGKLRAG